MESPATGPREATKSGKVAGPGKAKTRESSRTGDGRRKPDRLRLQGGYDR